MNRRTFIKGLGLGATMAAASALKAPGVKAYKNQRVWRMATSWTKDMPILQSGAERFAELTGREFFNQHES